MSPPEREEDSHRRRPAEKRSEGRRRRERRTVEAATSEDSDSETEAELSPPTTDTDAVAEAVAVASSEALSAAFEPAAESEAAAVPAQADALAVSVTTEVVEAAEDTQADKPTPELIDEADTQRSSAEVIGDVIGALVRDTSGITDSGRAVNDPRIAPKPIVETQIVTEQAQLFARPEAPPVTVVQQDVPRASNDPRGPRAA